MIRKLFPLMANVIAMYLIYELGPLYPVNNREPLIEPRLDILDRSFPIATTSGMGGLCSYKISGVADNIGATSETEDPSESDPARDARYTELRNVAKWICMIRGISWQVTWPSTCLNSTRCIVELCSSC